MNRKKQKFSLVAGLLLLVACNPGPGTPAYTIPTPTRLPQPTLDTSFRPVSLGQGPCVGVQDPTDGPPASGEKTFSAPERMIATGRTYCAIITTEKGRMIVQLYPEVAPEHVNSFVFLARKGYYDGVTFHRVLEGFMAQTGDPTGTGSGGPGYTIPLETSPAALFDREGVLGMARTSDPDSAGSQFFITFGPTQNLNPSSGNPGYTVFGQLVEGMDVLRQITLRDPDTSPTFTGDAMRSVRIVEK
jgi:peptidylprolyl isomerase